MTDTDRLKVAARAVLDAIDELRRQADTEIKEQAEFARESASSRESARASGRLEAWQEVRSWALDALRVYDESLAAGVRR